ncbi:FAD-dependent monooxygenase [Candidatus Mycobacterium methanotrophicum]|uniref:FAD-dependent monooxygenase n=1 Tax=Candidatus Mycobacterium methanotrophicum TaxID=2943498 RepID=A0ABY4QHC5_9MYCO|nr:FAD-dependent monooxygenase [Candidatus Mycobacterium methanotrophicum]UQX10415.1 FAD-dependent monooxygenase [Candidatus Mycobacterium methanotrophicum]
MVDVAGHHRFSVGSRGDGIQPRTLEVFEDLGVIDEVISAGMAAPVTRFYADGRVVWEGRMAEPVAPRSDVPYPNVWFVPQWRTEQILRSRLAAHGVQVGLGAGVVEFDQDEEGVTTRLNGGETVRAAYLVGADGGGSTVRRQLAVPFVGETDEDVRMLVTDVRVDGLDHDYGHAWMLDGGAFLVFTPLAGADDTFVVATRASRIAPTLEALQQTLEAASGRTDVRLHELTWSTIWRPNVRMTQQFRMGRVFLAGDAAHVHPPTGGQGLNTGVQDGYNLGWKLAAVLAGVPAELLDSYQAERLPVAARVLGISAALLEKHLNSADDAFERGEETRQLDVSYRGGPLTLDDGSSCTLVAGDRAPDAPCLDQGGRPVRLFNCYTGPHWTLLRFGVAAPVLDRADGWSYRIGSDLVDADRHIQDAYDIKDGAAALIRPDGYIGAITSRPADLAAYAARVMS